MRQKLIDILKALEAAIPPAPDWPLADLPLGHHAIVFCEYGCDKGGWKEELALIVNDGGKFRICFLDDHDLEMGSEHIATLITNVKKVLDA